MFLKAFIAYCSRKIWSRYISIVYDVLLFATLLQSVNEYCCSLAQITKIVWFMLSLIIVNVWHCLWCLAVTIRLNMLKLRISCTLTQVIMNTLKVLVMYTTWLRYTTIGIESARVPFQLLAHIGSKREVALRWYEFGRAVGVDSEILEEGSNYPPEEAIIQIFEWWSRNRTVTWKDVSEMLNNIGLQKLSSCILGNGRYLRSWILLVKIEISVFWMFSRKFIHGELWNCTATPTSTT